MMRRVGLALLGFAGGAALGVVAAFTIVWLWFDILDLGGPEGSAKPGLDVLIVLTPILMLSLGALSALWIVRRDRAGHSVVALAVAGVVGLATLALMGLNVVG